MVLIKDDSSLYKTYPLVEEVEHTIVFPVMSSNIVRSWAETTRFLIDTWQALRETKIVARWNDDLRFKIAT